MTQDRKHTYTFFFVFFFVFAHIHFISTRISCQWILHGRIMVRFRNLDQTFLKFFYSWWWPSFHDLHVFFGSFTITRGRHHSWLVLDIFPRNNFSRHLTGLQRQVTIKGRQDKQFYWIRLIRLEINTEKPLGHERANGSPPSLLLSPRISPGYFLSRVSFARLARRTKRKRDCS